jgi:hypothetical protein
VGSHHSEQPGRGIVGARQVAGAITQTGDVRRGPALPRGERGAWDSRPQRVPLGGLPASVCGPVAMTGRVTTPSPDGRDGRLKIAQRTRDDNVAHVAADGDGSGAVTGHRDKAAMGEASRRFAVRSRANWLFSILSSPP